MKRQLILPIILAMLLIAIFALTNYQPKDPFADIPNPIATITMDDGSVMQAELYLSAAPNTVSNFVLLANSGFYDGLSFYHIVNNAFIQTGDPTGTGVGGAPHTIRGEFSKNGFDNPISHERGVLSMARLPDDFNSASSQFFIMQGYFSEYDGEYAAFGKLIGEDSYKVLDTLGATPTDGNRRALVMHYIDTIRVDTKGFDYDVVKITK